MRENWDLFLTFARISASCFGGGYAMLPFFQRELVSKKGWLTDEELLDLNAVAQCTPGVIAVNTATFCGYRVHGLSGSLLATLGVLVPPMIIVTIISAFFWSFAENPWVQHALTGVRACVCALIINSTIRLYRKAVLDLPTFLVFLTVLILAAFVGLSPAILVVGAGLFGLYWEFFLVGLFSMGGGMATVPFLFDLSARTGWFTTADLTTMIAISEATPGPIGVNMATYVGYVSAGIPGSIIAPLGLVTPAVIIILLVSKILNTLWQNPKVKGLFYALRPASVGLIGAAAFSVCAVSLFSTEQGLVLHWPSILLFGIMLAAMNLPKLKELPSVFFIAVAAVVGIVFQMVD